MTAQRSRPRLSKLTWLKRTNCHDFTPTEFRVLVAVFNHTDADGRKAHPGLKLLAQETGAAQSTVSEALSGLKRKGWIRETGRGSGRTRRASEFELVPDAPSNTSQRQEVQNFPASGNSEPTTSQHGPSKVPGARKPSDPLSDPDYRSGSDHGELRLQEPKQRAPQERGLEPALAVEEEIDTAEGPQAPEAESTAPSGAVRDAQRAGELDPSDAELRRVAIPWPRNKPLPKGDPFAVYVDDESGDLFVTVPGKLPKVRTA